MLKTILILVVVALAAVLVYAATRPDSFRIARSLDIAAPPEKIYPLINDLHRWREWSPYEKKDPTMQRTFSGSVRPTRGKATRRSAKAGWRLSKRRRLR